MTDTPHLAAIRRDFARRMAATTGIEDAAVEAAFALVPRENFLGEAPWVLLHPVSGLHRLERNDPVRVYDDVLVQLDQERGVNNGSPSLHALMLHHLAVQPGDSILHIGAGTGYYTAILAELAGAVGRVTAIEYDGALATAARENLRPWHNVTVIQGDGADYPQGPVARIYVNFGVARPAALWLDNLTAGGTLEFPLAVPRTGSRKHSGTGAVLLITRTPQGDAARFVSTCAFVVADGPLAGDFELRARLNAAFDRHSVEFVGSLRRGETSPERCWFWSPEWSLSYDPPGQVGVISAEHELTWDR